MAEIAGVTIGAVGLVFPIYDACSRIWEACQVMRTFGRDVQLLWMELRGQWTLLQLLMNRYPEDLADPPQLTNSSHPVTAAIVEQLSLLLTHFTECERFVKEVFDESGLRIVGDNSPDVDFSKPAQAQLAQSGRSAGPVDADALSTPVNHLNPTSSKKDTGRPTRWSRLHPRHWVVRQRQISHSPSSPNRPSGSPAQDTSLQGPATPGDHASSSSTTQLSSTTAQATGRSDQVLQDLETVECSVRVISQQGEAAQKIQRLTGTWTHLRWSHHQMQDLQAHKKAIRLAIKTLKSILSLRNPTHPDRLVAPDLDLKTVPFNEAHQSALLNLHQALRNANGRTMQL